MGADVLRGSASVLWNNQNPLFHPDPSRTEIDRFRGRFSAPS